MSFIFIGHRGTGKTTLAEELRLYGNNHPQKELKVIDLDSEIEVELGQSIIKFWESNGEVEFRKVEQRVFEKVIKSTFDLLVLGAGFEIKLQGAPLSQHEVVWIRRESDKLGRVFFDRPSFSESSPIDSYLYRFPSRESSFALNSDWTLSVREGPLEPQISTIYSLLFLPQTIDASLLTYTPTSSECSKKRFVERLKEWSVGWIELRTDLLTEEEIINFIQEHENSFSFLVSVRTMTNDGFRVKLNTIKSKLQKKFLLDCDYTFMDADGLTADIVSVHNSAEALSPEALKNLKNRIMPTQHLKLALHTQDFDELSVIHSLLPENSIYLPISDSGRWAWYRLQVGSLQPLKFFRLGSGSVSDQPTLLEYLMHAKSTDTSFAAVLGDPVIHSRSPMEHYQFFRKHGWPFYSISISLDEWTTAIDWLLAHGLKACAVTSPLKVLAGALLHTEPLNTLAVSKTKLLGENTDELALSDFSSSISSPVVLWGASGLEPTVRKVWPDVNTYSARTGSLKTASPLQDKNQIHTLIWGVPRQRMKEGAQWPPAHWKPQTVFDLNYGENSPGREYAQIAQAAYRSGLEFFERQAQYQRVFWSKILFQTEE